MHAHSKGEVIFPMLLFGVANNSLKETMNNRFLAMNL